jgi:ABC-type phosphate transport system permease subunit
LLDLAAAIPSLIFGLWGVQIFTSFGERWANFLAGRLGWIPIFNSISDNFGRSPFVAGLVLAALITPITTSVAREVYSRTPRELIDTCYALGSSKWGAIKTVVIPFGKSGVVGGAMLGLGRALGETVAVYLVLNLNFRYTFRILESEGGNVASLIATKFGEATPDELKALVAAGFVLFVLTLSVNMVASRIVNRSQGLQHEHCQRSNAAFGGGANTYAAMEAAKVGTTQRPHVCNGGGCGCRDICTDYGFRWCRRLAVCKLFLGVGYHLGSWQKADRQGTP